MLLSFQSLAFIDRRTEGGSTPVHRRTWRSGTPAYLHDAVPVIARGDLEQGEEGHAEVLEGGVTTHTLAWVVCVANWGPERRNAGREKEKKKKTEGDERTREETGQVDKTRHRICRYVIADFVFEVIGWCVCSAVFSNAVFRSLTPISEPGMTWLPAFQPLSHLYRKWRSLPSSPKSSTPKAA